MKWFTNKKSAHKFAHLLRVAFQSDKRVLDMYMGRWNRQALQTTPITTPTSKLTFVCVFPFIPPSGMPQMHIEASNEPVASTFGWNGLKAVSRTSGWMQKGMFVLMRQNREMKKVDEPASLWPLRSPGLTPPLFTLPYLPKFQTSTGPPPPRNETAKNL